MSDTSRAEADQYLLESPIFRLGHLPTEQQNPLTKNLSFQAQNDVAAGINALHAVDVHALGVMAHKGDDLARLQSAIAETFRAGFNVFFYGCGATGRLSLSLEYLWNSVYRGERGRVHGFMSGGDVALVHSIEKFEDFPSYGARQVREAGFREGDLMVAITEGGETPSVIGAVEEAARISQRPPFYLYCNPTDLLRDTIERSRNVIGNPHIEKIEVFTGPQGLSGSTRMQASTVLMLMAGAALMNLSGHDLRIFKAYITGMDFTPLAPFIEAESALYTAETPGHVLYETREHGITVFTDVTERAPTFSLPGIENQKNPERAPTLAYPCIPSASNAFRALYDIIGRAPRGLEWPELKGAATQDRLMGFDFSVAARQQRAELIGSAPQETFGIYREGNDLRLTLADMEHRIDVADMPPLLEHLTLKMALNIHSTLVMGRLGRYEQNVMTWVKPSNNKLIDRAIRYVMVLEGMDPKNEADYVRVCHRLFGARETLQPGEAIVPKTRLALRAA